MRFDDKMNISTPLISFEEAARMLCFTPESAQSKYSAGTFPVRVANIGRKRVVRRDEVMHPQTIAGPDSAGELARRIAQTSASS